MYIHSMEHRSVRLLSRHYDLTATGYKYLEIGINWSTELREKSSRTRTVSRNVEESLRAMEYLQDASKRIQGQFYKC